MQSISAPADADFAQLRAPGFWYWVKVGAGVTVGATIVLCVASITWLIVGAHILAAVFTR